jgi:hypothetical protein
MTVTHAVRLFSLCWYLSVIPTIHGSILDATSKFVKSSEAEYDHEVTLIAGQLTFHWNDATGNTLECRLIHKAPSIEKAPSWLGIGFYDTFSNKDPVTSFDPSLLLGSDAVIGIVASSNVQKYGLDGTDVGEAEDTVHPLKHQTLIDAVIKRHDSDDGGVNTILSFTKELEESNLEEVRLRKVGTNVFFYGMGAPGEKSFVMNQDWGAFTLNLDAVASNAEKGQSETISSEGGEEASTSDGNDGTNTARIVDGQCGSSLEGYERQFIVAPDIIFFWKIEGNILKAAVKVDHVCWIGFGISENGMMIGSKAIIGKPGDSSVAVYELLDKGVETIQEFTEKTSLKAGSIKQDDESTIMTFEYSMDDGSTLSIASSGLNTFLYAHGKDNTFGYHESRGNFRIDLATCDSGSEGRSTRRTHMGVFAAHGTIATLAWAIASPFAMTVAWFRTLVPSSWIYIHVFSNVCSFFFTLIAVIIAVSAMSMQKNPSHFNHPHHWVGLSMLIGITFQVMNGFLRPPVEKRDPYSTSHYDIHEGFIKMPRTPREVWYFSHRLTGISLLAMGVYQIVSGLDLFAANYNVASIAPWFWGYVGIFAFSLISLKFWIMYEEYKARRGMEAMHVEHRGGGTAGGISDDLVPVQFDMS